MTFDEETLDEHGECREEIHQLQVEVERLQFTNGTLREGLEATVDLLKATNPNQPISLAAIVRTVCVLEDILADDTRKAAEAAREDG